METALMTKNIDFLISKNLKENSDDILDKQTLCVCNFLLLF